MKLEHPSGTYWNREPALEWRPMKEAPRKSGPDTGHSDGPPIVVRSQHHAYAVVHWHGGAWHHGWDNRLLEFEPVEWSPIVPYRMSAIQ